MSQTLRILLAQTNPLVGAVETNTKAILALLQKEAAQYDLVVFPELALTGYPPEDLLFRDTLYEAVARNLDILTAASRDTRILVGHPIRAGNHCHNAVSLLGDGKREGLYRKQKLPNYGIFDEKRYFSEGPPVPFVFTLKGYRIGVCICEDLWHQGPVDALIAADANIVICLNASPFDTGKMAQRVDLAKHYATQGVHLLYVNLAGGQDELVFDGRSFAVDTAGNLVAVAPAFAPALLPVTIHEDALSGPMEERLEGPACLYAALVCGIRDYVEKNRFPGVLLGLSGGVDSALTLALAVDALGKEHVHAVLMPSRYTAPMSMEDALWQVKTLGCRHTILSIESAFSAFTNTLAPVFAGLPEDVTEENLQARIRGMLLMALSNKTGDMVLITSNKSETATGYSTLYGDMAGGFAPLKDVYKTDIYALCAWRNRDHTIIPGRVIQRPPSAELAPEQTDQDTLPDYALLDALLKAFIEENASVENLVAQGFHPQTVERITQMVLRNEYKRRQAPPGIKVTRRAFGRDWRYPISSGFKA